MKINMDITRQIVWICFKSIAVFAQLWCIAVACAGAIYAVINNWIAMCGALVMLIAFITPHIEAKLNQIQAELTPMPT